MGLSIAQLKASVVKIFLPVLMCGIFWLGLLTHIPKAAAWEQSTHIKMTQEAIRHIQDQVNPRLTNNLGLPNGLSEVFFIQSAEMHILAGSNSEDIPDIRGAHHFHDPLATSIANAGLNVAGLSGKSSIDWMLLPKGDQGGLVRDPITGVFVRSTENWSWQDAREFFFHALTDPTQKERDQNFAKTFQALGHVMHLIQDAANPAHVRNDIHLDRKPLEDLDAFHRFFDPKAPLQPFLTNGIQDPHPSLLLQMHQDASITDPLANLIDNNVYKEGDPPENSLTQTPLGSFAGNAEFANANFFSDDTVPGPFSEFVHPSEADLTEIPGSPYLSLKRNGATFLKFAVKRGFEALFGQRQIPQIKIKQFLLDNTVFNEYAKKLIPRAVGYSAAVLPYFFRGQLFISGTLGGTAGNEQVTLDVSNQGPVALGEGTLTICYDKNDNTRTCQVAKVISSPNPGQAVDPITFPLPTDFAPGKENLYHMIFRGAFGPEGAQELDTVIGQMNILVEPCFEKFNGFGVIGPNFSGDVSVKGADFASPFSAPAPLNIFEQGPSTLVKISGDKGDLTITSSGGANGGSVTSMRYTESVLITTPLASSARGNLNFPVDITITGPTFARVKATTQQSFIGGSTPFTTNLFPPEGLSPGVLDFITFSSGVPVDVTFEIFFNHKSSELNPGSGTFNLQYALEDLEVIPLGGDSEFLFEGFTINFCRAAEPPIPSPLP